ALDGARDPDQQPGDAPQPELVLHQRAHLRAAAARRAAHDGAGPGGAEGRVASARGGGFARCGAQGAADVRPGQLEHHRDGVAADVGDGGGVPAAARYFAMSAPEASAAAFGAALTAMSENS